MDELKIIIDILFANLLLWIHTSLFSDISDSYSFILSKTGTLFSQSGTLSSH